MKLFLDSANVEEIEKRLHTGIIEGVTTNPTLIKKSGRKPDEVYADLIENLGVQDLSIEVNGWSAEDLMQNGITYGKCWTHEATIKLPCTQEGIKACKILSDMGIRTNVTLVFSVEQAILCSIAGATYVSPFIGRLDDIGQCGISVLRDIAEVLRINRSDTKVLAASIRDKETVGLAFEAGAEICTVPPEVFDEMFRHELTDAGLRKFMHDSGQAP